MGIKIQTTGLEQFTPGGTARLQLMIVGIPDSGKSRLSSYMPKPIFGTCESVASLADRNVPFAQINNSRDMADFLEYVRLDSLKPSSLRKHSSVVIDTVDTYARKLKIEFQDANPNPKSAYEIWSFLEQKLQYMLIKLLNLDSDVIVLGHPEDRKTAENGGEATIESVLSLQGKMQTTILNDFDLIGVLEPYWANDGNGRVEKRRLTFKRTPQRMWLKDKLNLSKDKQWFDVEFRDGIWDELFEPLHARIRELKASTLIDEVESIDETPPPNAFVVHPDAAKSGPVPNAEVGDIPLEELDRPMLFQRARAAKLPVKGNTTKGELLQMLKDHYAAQPATPAPVEDAGQHEPAPQAQPTASIEPVAASDPQSELADRASAEVLDSGTTPAAQAALKRRMPTKKTAEKATPVKTETVEEGVVDVNTGELVEEAPTPTAEQAIKTVASVLGGDVVSDEDLPTEGPVCGDCGISIPEDNDTTRLSRLRFKEQLCPEHFQAGKDSGRAKGHGQFHKDWK